MNARAPKRRRGVSTRRSAGTRSRTSDVEVMIHNSVPDSYLTYEAGCIDLTCEYEHEIVDLTSPNDPPPVSLGVDVSARTNGNHQRKTRTQCLSRLTRGVVADSRSNSPDLPIIDFGTSASSSKKTTSTKEKPVEAKSNKPAETRSFSLSCPICFDTDREILESNRQLMSTVCGHVFCDSCITETIRSTHCCPRCRKKLLLKHIHPIFLDI